MTFVPATLPSLIAFLVIVASLILFFVGAHFFAARRLRRSALGPVTFSVVGLIFYLSACLCVVGSGWMEAEPMPRLPLFLAGTLAVAVIFALSRGGRFLSAGLPIWMLIAFQGFRLPLEMVLHDWAEQGVIPYSMTWDGQNFDIISGIVALVIAPLASRSHRLAWVANLVGLGLLLNVMRVAVMSSPLPFAWPVTPPLQLATQIPYFLIVPICVAGALAGHLLLTRALLARR